MEMTPCRDLTNIQQTPQLPPSGINHTDEATKPITKKSIFPPSCLYENQKDRCSICLDSFTNPAQIIPCGHIFDLHCFKEWSPDGMDSCPMCRQYTKEIHHNFTESGEYSKIDTITLLIDSLCSLDQNICTGAWEKMLSVMTGDKVVIHDIIRGDNEGCFLLDFEIQSPVFDRGHYEIEYDDYVVLFERLSENRWRFIPVDEKLQEDWSLLIEQGGFDRVHQFGYYMGDEYGYKIVLTVEQALAVSKVCSKGKCYAAAIWVLWNAYIGLLERLIAPSSNCVLEKREFALLCIFGLENLEVLGVEGYTVGE